MNRLPFKIPRMGPERRGLERPLSSVTIGRFGSKADKPWPPSPSLAVSGPFLHALRLEPRRTQTAKVVDD
jgi:hypothetical protein